jgi:2-polyprenyl-3-methyl-5-hydroxy-6-metoxy-1,4-benzoquinol methylase
MSTDYFSNHPRASKFPWSIYHRPLERHLAEFLADVARMGAHPRVLVVGAGYLHELPAVPPDVRLTAVDVDERVVAHLATLEDPRLERCLVVREPADLLALGPFDGIYAKEVIEHIVEIEPYMAILMGLLRPGGMLWVSTPNYGEPWLPLLESTVLELIGRLSGYSRKHLHPTRFSAARLRDLLEGCSLEAVQVEKTPFRLALVGAGRKRSG